MHIFGELVHIFGRLVHILAWKLVSRTSKQVLINLGALWQQRVYNDTSSYGTEVRLERTGSMAHLHAKFVTKSGKPTMQH